MCIYLFIFICSLFKGPVFLGHCAASRKVEGSIPNGVIEIFHW